MFVVESKGMDWWLDSCDPLTGKGSRPWSMCNVGAPKKKGFRGGDAAAASQKGVAARKQKVSDVSQQGEHKDQTSGVDQDDEKREEMRGFDVSDAR